MISEGGGPGNSIHSWRCEYPDRYGPCDCVAETVRGLWDVVVEGLRLEWRRGSGEVPGCSRWRRLGSKWQKTP